MPIASTLTVPTTVPVIKDILGMENHAKVYIIHSDKGLTLEMPALETPYYGKFALSTQLIKVKLSFNTPHQHSSPVSLKVLIFI